MDARRPGTEHHHHHATRIERLNDPQRLDLIRPELLWEALASPSPRVAVDLGAGTGLVTAAFARLAPSAHFYAVDVSPEMLAFMREHLPADVAGRITVVEATDTSVPLETDLADALTMIGVYHEFEDPQASLAEAHRILVPSGRLLISDWKKGTAAPGFGPDEASRVSAEDIAEAMREAGFGEVVEHDFLERFSVITATR